MEVPYIYKMIKVIPGDMYISRCAMEGRIWDSWMLPYLAVAAKHQGVFLDVGANIGLDAVLFSCFGPVWAFEPVHFELLSENTQGTFYPVQALNCAVSDTDGEAVIHLYEGGNHGAHSIEIDHGGPTKIVPTKRLDSLLDQIGPVAFLKIDVEGHEYKVLDGAKELIQKWKPLMVIESFDKERLEQWTQDNQYEMMRAPEHNYVLIYRGNLQ